MLKCLDKVLNNFGYYKKETLIVPKPTKSKSATKRARQKMARNEFKNKVRKVLPQVCWNCGSKEDLQIHHIYPVSKRPDLVKNMKNLIMLCAVCHSHYHYDCKE